MVLWADWLIWVCVGFSWLQSGWSSEGTTRCLLQDGFSAHTSGPSRRFHMLLFLAEQPKLLTGQTQKAEGRNWKSFIMLSLNYPYSVTSHCSHPMDQNQPSLDSRESTSQGKSGIHVQEGKNSCQPPLESSHGISDQHSNNTESGRQGKSEKIAVE